MILTFRMEGKLKTINTLISIKSNLLREYLKDKIIEFLPIKITEN